MKKVIIFVAAVLFVLFFLRFVIGGSEDTWICVNGEWIEHGKPSSPKPLIGCEEDEAVSCYSSSGKKMSLDEARVIAQKKCVDGQLKETGICNDYTGTWWIDFLPNQLKEGCNPACVVNVDTAEAEINWRCTGLIENE